jgi:hypothetical protein
MLYKIVYSNGAYHVVPADENTLLGYEIRPYGSLADCMERAELRATRHARQASGGAKGRRFVRRDGTVFSLVKAEPQPEQPEEDDWQATLSGGKLS